MNKTHTILFFLLFLCYKAGAQKEAGDLELVIQPQLFIPTSDLKLTNKLSVGGYISFEKIISDKFSALLSFGGGLLPGKNYATGYGYNDTYPTITIAQLRTGAKYFFYKDHLWISGLIGVAQSFQQGASSFGFSYSPALGYAIGEKFDISVRYDASSFKHYDINGIGINLGYHVF